MIYLVYPLAIFKTLLPLERAGVEFIFSMCKYVGLIYSNTHACLYAYTQKQRLSYLVVTQVKRVRNTEREVKMLIPDTAFF